jgi:hypothetical protein
LNASAKSAADVAAGIRQVEAEAAAVAGAGIGRGNVDIEMGWVGDFEDKDREMQVRIQSSMRGNPCRSGRDVYVDQAACSGWS